MQTKKYKIEKKKSNGGGFGGEKQNRSVFEGFTSVFRDQRQQTDINST